jgi:SAM-dependent methyltransferase
MDKLEKQLAGIYNKFWIGYDQNTIEVDIKRHAFNVTLVRSMFGQDITVCDIGGGWGAFSVACCLLEMKAILIDDFQDAGFRKNDDPRYKLLKKYDVTVINRDAVAEGLGFEASSVDVFTSFDSMEHWHNSPKRLFHQIARALKKGGGLILEVPNNANLRKRIEAILGKLDWSSMDDWYESDTFRGHVREPNIRDLRYIAHDMGLDDVKIFGRNWLGLYSGNQIVRALTRIIDHPLRLFPSLCTNLYLVGRKKA